MTTVTINGTRPRPRSAYPRPVSELLPEARRLAEQLGELPSRNRLMRDLRIGAPKAEELRDALVGEQRAAEAEAEVDEDRVEPNGRSAESADSASDSTADSGGLTESTSVRKPDASAPAPDTSAQVTTHGHPGTPGRVEQRPTSTRPVAAWPVVLLALPAFVAVWGGWVGLGKLTGFGRVNLLPGIADGFEIDTAITLPIGMEVYAAYALYVWLSGRAGERARRFARTSALVSLVIGAAGQVAYHLLVAAGVTAAPWWITTSVACLPVAVLGMGAALAHLVREGQDR